MAPQNTSSIASDSVEQKILQFISTSNLKPGEALPSEAHLTELLGVSRTTVREAISRLRAYSMIRGNKRGGNILCKPNIFSGLTRLMEFGLLTAPDLKGLMTLRILIEVGSAEHIFNNATNADFRELRHLAEHSDDDVLQGDIAFHRRLVSIGCGMVATDFEELLNAVFLAPCYEYSFIADNDISHSVNHQMLCDELEHGTAASFSAALKKHLRVYDDLFAPDGTTCRQEQ